MLGQSVTYVLGSYRCPRKAAGDEAFMDLLDYLSERNAAAAIALRARKEDLTALHSLDVPSTLNVTFLSTNCIENAFRN